MKELKRDLQSMVKSVKALTQKTEKMIKTLDKLEKSQMAKKAKKKAIIMPEIKYIYPNVSGIVQRGGLIERWQLAQPLGCEYVEMPADFVKNRSEIQKTGLQFGALLSNSAIEKLYSEHQDQLPLVVKYVLHTEPSPSRNQAPLKWYDQNWVEQFTDMMLSISSYLGLPASVIEIHPGDKRNTFLHVLDSVVYLHEKYYQRFWLRSLTAKDVIEFRGSRRFGGYWKK